MRKNQLPGDAHWWRNAVVYQIYPRSFADHNGDGIGDIRGIISRIDYLAKLGIDAVWLSPFYPSALADGGYDVDDYMAIDPRIGTMAEFDEMVEKLHAKNIRVFVDIVPNHSSDRHVWFQEALAAPRGSAARDRYIFRDGKSNGEPPSKLASHFGPTGWTQVADGQWYMHLFTKEQPDFNWDNEDVNQYFLDTLRFWSDRGVDGFRIDVAHALKKNLDPLPDRESFALSAMKSDGTDPLFDRDEVHEVYAQWRKVFNEYDPPRVAVAEAWVHPNRVARYASEDGLGQSFNFDLLGSAWDARAFREKIAYNLELSAKTGSSSTWVLSNHDVIRHVTRLSYKEIPKQGDGIGPDYPQPDEAKGQRIGRAASAFMLGLPGSSYLYQGEELGLPEHTTLESEYRQDPTFFRTNGERVGRDGCRVPIPWEADAPAFGFSETGKSWLPQPENYRGYSRDRQQGVAGSTLELYKRLLSLRKSNALGDGNLAWVESLCTDSTLAYKNNSVLVVANFGPDSLALPEGELLVTTQHDLSIEGVLEHDQVAWIKL